MIEDRLRLQWRGQRPIDAPEGFVDYRGCWLLPGTAFRRDDLIEIARANGQRLTPDLLAKWRNWRLLPGPTPGGPTGKGRGKGETWPQTAAILVAWISRSLTDTLTYDVIRVAMWPWKPAFERERIGQLRHSLDRYLHQDRSFHYRFYGIAKKDADLDSLIEGAVSADSVDAAYLNLILLGGTDEQVNQLLEPLAALGVDAELLERERRFLPHLNLPEMEELVLRASDEDLREFIAAYRSAGKPVLQDALWTNPLGVARSVMTELHRFMLDR